MSENKTTPAATPETNAPAAAPKFRDDLLAHVEKLRPLATLDKDSGIITIPASAYYDLAPAGVTQESDLASVQYRDLNVNAAALLSGQMGVDGFKANPKLGSVSLSMPVRKHTSIEVVWNRDGSSRNPGTGEVTTYRGSLGTRRFDERSTRTNAEMTDIKADIRRLMPQTD